MLAAYAWFAIGIPVTALTSAVSMFGLLRFLTRDTYGFTVVMASLSINRGYRSGLAIWPVRLLPIDATVSWIIGDAGYSGPDPAAATAGSQTLYSAR